MWLAQARRVIETHLGAAVYKIGDKNVLPFRFHDRSGTGDLRTMSPLKFRKINLAASRFHCHRYYDLDLVWWRRSRAGGVRLEALYYAEIDAEKEGVLSAQYPRLHTGGAPEPNITQTIEHIKHEIYEILHQTG